MHNFPGCFLFGFAHYEDIEGPLVCGRWIFAKQELKRIGLERTTLPWVFIEGGAHRPAVGGKGKWKTGMKPLTWEEERVRSVMGLVIKHEGEYRKWHHAWGRSEGSDDEWQPIGQQAFGGIPADQIADHPLLMHHQLQLTPRTAWAPSDLQSARMAMGSGSGTTLVRKSAGERRKSRK